MVRSFHNNSWIANVPSPACKREFASEIRPRNISTSKSPHATPRFATSGSKRTSVRILRRRIEELDGTIEELEVARRRLEANLEDCDLRLQCYAEQMEKRDERIRELETSLHETRVADAALVAQAHGQQAETEQVLRRTLEELRQAAADQAAFLERAEKHHEEQAMYLHEQRAGQEKLAYRQLIERIRQTVTRDRARGSQDCRRE